MKIKVQPQDFVVREESRVSLTRRPDRFQVFRLVKSQWDTFDLVDLLARRLGVPRRAISYGGIKDRFGRTEQLISVHADGRRIPGLREKNFSLLPVGYAREPVTAKDIRGNRFTIVLRDVEERLVEPYLAACESIRLWGVPNYYDEQRFGSARHGKGFMGKEIFLGRREKALRLYFQPSGHDDRKTRALKSCVIERWGRWEECLPLAFGEYRRLLEYLKRHRSAFTRALGLIDRKFLVFVLNAYQSYLFNEVLAGTLCRLQEPYSLRLAGLPWRWGSFLFYERLPEGLFDRLREQDLPVPGYDTPPPGGEAGAADGAGESADRFAAGAADGAGESADRFAAGAADGAGESADRFAAGEALREVLAREAISLRELKARQIPGVDVRGARRRMLLCPEELAAGQVREDELYPGRKRITLEFFLPRGGYATMLLKRLEAEESLRRRDG